MGSERSQNAPGERGPAGEIRCFHTPRLPRLPRSPARSLGASHGRQGAARGFGICASGGQEEECCQREDERWMVMPATYG